MSTIVTRTSKGSALTFAEVDGNFTNLNTDKLETSTAASTYAALSGATFTGAIKSSGTQGVGYATGAGGTINQATSRTTGVTLSKLSGSITLFSTTTTAGLINVFTVTNTLVAITDTIVLSHASGGTAGQYIVYVASVAAGSFQIAVYTPAAQGTAAAPVINFTVVKGVTA
jgi:hypothetical protein